MFLGVPYIKFGGILLGLISGKKLGVYEPTFSLKKSPYENRSGPPVCSTEVEDRFTINKRAPLGARIFIHQTSQR